MPDDLISWIEQRIDADPDIDDEMGLVVLAALEGDEQLDDYLATGDMGPRAAQATPAIEAPPATGAFLRSIEVIGFRGIGASAKLQLDPAPGLTVVAGRNGSGKSSIAEGLEVLLTGNTYRWKTKQSTQWSDRWRNLHHEGSPQIEAVIVEEGSGPIHLRTEWAADATDVNAHTTTAQRTVGGTKGPRQPASLLGWAGPLETYRPMLSYDELGGLLEAGPSELYDALAKVLGTEQLADALRRIKTRLDTLTAPQKGLTAERKYLQMSAGELDDERAAAVAPLLRKTSPDVAAIRALATGITLPDRGIVASLRALSQLQAPEPSAVATAAARLRRAVEAMAAAGEHESARRVARLDVRRRALHLHTEHGEQSCPVCTLGTLDEAWERSTRDLIGKEDREMAALSDAREELEAARQALRRHVGKVPAALDRSPLDDLEAVVTSARAAWSSFEGIPQGDLALADHLELHAEHLDSTVAAARVAATSALSERDDAWSPLASRISRWCESWTEWLARKPEVDRLAAAEKWLKDNDTRLKNERIAPIADAAKHAWALLRQESNVDLGELRLEGQAKRRRVAITATIDGEYAGGALPVMSQGELHALALALFLPRAGVGESPFRFVVLDDPVQAMDPAKVDGLVTLLMEIARTRQVIVFSHDDRLPAALRRVDASARIFEVTRGPDSAVTIEMSSDPSTRYLHDAESLVRDDDVPDQTLRRTLPGLLRMALESAARDRFYATRLARGEALTAVEETWSQARKTGQRISLALYDEIKPLDDWLRTESRKKALGVATTGFHETLHSDPVDAVYHSRRVVEELRQGAK